MDDVTLQITINGAGKMADLAKLVDTAMSMRDPEPSQQVIPAGYRCQECYDGDGGHQVTCSFYKVQTPQ